MRIVNGDAHVHPPVDRREHAGRTPRNRPAGGPLDDVQARRSSPER